MTRAQRRRLRAILFPILAVLLTLSLWEVTADLWEVPELILPSPLAVLGTLQEQYPDLLPAMAGTFREVLEGSALAFLGGLLLGIAMFYSEILRRTLLSYIVLTQIVPKIAIAPVLVAWLGIGSGARLMIAFLIAFFPMVINTVAGLECTEKDMLLYARSLSATKSQIFWKIRLPRSLPALLAGLRIAVASSIIGIVVGEFVASEQGIGRIILTSAVRLETSVTIAAVCLVGVMGLLLLGVVDAVERMVVKWGKAD
ncbi:MAG: hypothetical protein AUI47_05540 [Acidobacteria bacterium 13_1_40CM_2_68_5]|nr:MAG: hypothetical protein AUI47_05540 [Acidobacteria bacterium 13_1_40CM_2_68_5]